MNSIRSTLKRALLPNGFPSSVSDDYLEYQFWDSLQAFCSSIMNNLATQAILKGVGVGDVDATVLSATITWILKGNFCSMLYNDIPSSLISIESFQKEHRS
ncbi:RUS1 family protein C16orf58 -like protein [Sarcoptes scabiei]|uniref:RUS1 family protein C16orf58 -like protein n=1 Tax=Sarcoptes scabiei TaxID=52283 RepID=A0A834VFW6_SARSC|nr:RUS1 family protein C16orf58 -like protein [Sarcoptes scabiei]